MSNKKHTLTFDLSFDEDFNREVNELIKARVMETIRSNCQSIIDNAVNDMIPKIVADRVRGISVNDIRQAIWDAMGGIINTPEFRKIIDDVARQKVSERTDIDLAVSKSCADWVGRRLDRVVPADIVVAVTQALLKDSGDKLDSGE